MLVSFSVSNYRSFGEEVTLNMVASNKLTDHRHHLVPIGDTGRSLVRSALIYGANAAGKSNLVKAMEFARRLVGRQQQDRLPIAEAFRFQAGTAREPSSFEFRFLIDGQVFAYGFDVARDRIVGEWLTLRKGDDDLVVFERDAPGRTKVGDAVPYLSKEDPDLAKTLNILRQLPLRHRQLFLNRVSSVPDEVQGKTLRSVVKWITEDFKVLEAEHRSCDLLHRLHSDEAFRRFSEEFLRDVDTGITGLRFREAERECTEYEREFMSACSDDDDEAGYEMFECTGDMDVRLKPGDPSKVIIRTLLAEHRTPGRSFLLPFSEESMGTQQLLHFMPVLFRSKEENNVVVIDELDRSLHPLICWEFVKFFSAFCPGARTQLIVTTHEAHLLDQELLRRDEYWFVEKDEKQQSQLVPLSDFNVRKDLQVRKGYLDGRFGGVPVFGTLGGLREQLECQMGCKSSEGADAAQETPA